MAQHFIKVLLPLRLDWIPTYRADFPAEPGETVSVSFAGRRYIGVVWEETAAPDIPLKGIRPITSRDTSLPAVGRKTREFWAFLASYYMCTLGEVYAAAMHSIEGTQQKKTASELEKLRARLERTSANLLRRHGERVRTRLEAEADSLCREIAAREERLKSRSRPAETPERVPLQSRPQLIVGKGRIPQYTEAIRTALSQSAAGITPDIVENGPDAAGKNAAGSTPGGGQILVLSPSKAFCEKTEQQLREAFPDRLQTYHSGVSEAARRKISDRLRSGESLVVLGLRSAIFLPFTKLSLVIIDEEQDSFYKQTEPAPRYNGRDAAIYLAKLYGADVLLGSSFPSLESLYNCRRGKYRLLELESRGTDSPDELGEDKVSVIDSGAEFKKNGMVGYFSRKLIAEISACTGGVILIRGWEKPEELLEQTVKLFRDKNIRISTLHALKEDGAGEAKIIAVIGADAFFDQDDFRSDEKALQMVSVLSELSGHLVIQTNVPERFDGSHTAESLLAERQQFNFPPFRRIVDIRRKGSRETVRRVFLENGRSLEAQKQSIHVEPDCYADVDPA